MLKDSAREYPTWNLTERQLSDLELLLNGGFSPLVGFMGQADYERVLDEMRLTNGILWPMPITLDVAESFAQKVTAGSQIALLDPEGTLIAVMHVTDIWIPDRYREAERVYGSHDSNRPAVGDLLNNTNPVYLGGTVQGVTAPSHYDFKYLRHTPRELRRLFEGWGWHRVVAFHTNDPMHRAHQELTLLTMQIAEARLLIHPTVSMTKFEEMDYYVRIRCYEYMIKRYPKQMAALSLLPYAMRMAGPREAILQAIIRKNYGCTHLVLDQHRCHTNESGRLHDFYGSNESELLVSKYQDELGIQIIPFQEMVYLQDQRKYLPIHEVKSDQTGHRISDDELRRLFYEGLTVPEWASYPEIVEELRKAHTPKHKQGFTVFFTGLSGAGKSTIARALAAKILEAGRHVTLLDGDLVRKHLSSELGFSREHRDINILRIGFVASEITRHGGVAICAPIAPYNLTRRKVREMISRWGGFIEVYVATPLEICEARDCKGLYAKARKGMIKNFTGISDPYEIPEAPEVIVDTSECSPDEIVQKILSYLSRAGYWTMEDEGSV